MADHKSGSVLARSDAPKWRTIMATLAALALSGGPAAAIEVIVSIKPLHSIVASVMEGSGNAPYLLMEHGSSVRDFRLSGAQTDFVKAADLVFLASRSLETFMRPLPVSDASVELIDTAGLALLRNRPEGLFDVPPTISAAPLDLASDRDAVAPTVDPHFWLDPDNAKLVAGRIADELAAVDPANAAIYSINASLLAAELEDLDLELATGLRPFDRPYLVLHDAYQYFENRYALRALGSLSIGPDVPGGAALLAEMRVRAVESTVKCVFMEPDYVSRARNAVPDARDVIFATMDALGSEIVAGPDLYFNLMRDLASSLTGCLVP